VHQRASSAEIREAVKETRAAEERIAAPRGALIARFHGRDEARFRARPGQGHARLDQETS